MRRVAAVTLSLLSSLLVLSGGYGASDDDSCVGRKCHSSVRGSNAQRRKARMNVQDSSFATELVNFPPGYSSELTRSSAVQVRQTEGNLLVSFDSKTGKLQYNKYANQVSKNSAASGARVNIIPDFSNAGYKGGGKLCACNPDCLCRPRTKLST